MKKLFLIPLACVTFTASTQAAPAKKVKPVKSNAKPVQAAPVAKPVTKPVAAAKTNTITVAATNIIYDGPDNEAIKDLRQALQGFNAGEIKLEKVEIATRTGQEFYLVRKNEKTYIKYSVNTSLENAVYTLLDKWGFHWYGPGENWFVKPASITGADIAGKWVSPTFRNRSFFGTGGLDFPAPTPRAFDPETQYKIGWYAWKRRNRFNSDFGASGHVGQVFYLENKELLDAHPEWFNSDAGKQAGRLKIEIPEAVAAYKAWAKKRYINLTEPFINIGVDPEDGRGAADDPLPPAGFGGIANWNHADKWWWLANEVAKDYPENDAHKVVSMYAYGDGPTNALAPQFVLRKNVYPTIIPYAFQKAYLPNEMIKAWAGKINGKMGLYDYWNITQWSQGLPQHDIYGMKDKLKFWRDNKVDGLHIETTDAAGPMGHAWWLAGQLQFDMSKDFNAAYNQYLTDLFGKAAPAMKKMYDRWSRNPQGAGEVALSLADLQAAEALVKKNSPQWKRINELKAYVHFMKLYYAHDGTQESKNRLFEYLYSVHHLFMVQTAAFMGQYYISPLEKGNIIPVGTNKRLTDEEIDAQFQADLLSDPKKYEVLDFQFDYAKAKYTEPIANGTWFFGNVWHGYLVPRKSGTISFDVGMEGTDATFRIFNDDGVILKEIVGKSRFDYLEKLGDGPGARVWNMKKFTLKVEAGKRVDFKIDNGYNRFKMNSDEIVYTVHHSSDFDNYGYPAHYFYVPKNCDEIVFEDWVTGNATTSPLGFGASGEPSVFGTSIGIKGLYRIEVKPQWKGKVIACRAAHGGWNLKNLPNIFTLQPFEYKE